MSTIAIIVLAVVSLLAWCALLDAVKASLAIRTQASACPCRDIHSLTLTPGAAFELPAGINLSAGTNPEFAASFSTRGCESVREAFEECADRTKPSEEPEDGGPADPADLEAEVDEALAGSSLDTFEAFEDIRDAIDLSKAKLMAASDNLMRRLQGELLLIKVLRRRAERGAPARVD